MLLNSETCVAEAGCVGCWQVERDGFAAGGEGGGASDAPPANTLAQRVRPACPPLHHFAALLPALLVVVWRGLAAHALRLRVRSSPLAAQAAAAQANGNGHMAGPIGQRLAQMKVRPPPPVTHSPKPRQPKPTMLLLLLCRGRGRTGWRGGCHAPSTKSPATPKAAAAAAVAARGWASKGSHARPPRCNHSARRRARGAAAACSAPAREGSAPDPLHSIVGIFHTDGSRCVAGAGAVEEPRCAGRRRLRQPRDSRPAAAKAGLWRGPWLRLQSLRR